jgi:hypothetical protein
LVIKTYIQAVTISVYRRCIDARAN